MSTSSTTEGPMATPAPSDVGRRIPVGVPTIYADQVADVMYGVYTSKVVLGVEDGTNQLRPVATVVVPTSLLFRAALSIASDITRAGMIKETSERFAQVLEHMRVVGRGLHSEPSEGNSAGSTGGTSKPS